MSRGTMSGGEIREIQAEAPALRNGKPIASDVTASAPPSDGKKQNATDLDAAFDSDGLLSIDNLRALEAELVARESWAELAELYALAAQRAPEAETGREMLLSAGLLTFERLQDPRAAEPYLRRILAS